MTLRFAALAAVMLATAAAPAAAQTFSTTNKNLDTKIKADDYNDGVAETVYGTTGVAGTHNVQFTGNTAVNITDGAGYAQIGDADDVNNFVWLEVNPTEGFTQYAFSTQFAEDSYIQVAYSLGGGVFTEIGTVLFQSPGTSNTSYLIDSGGLVFDAIRIMSVGDALGDGTGEAFNQIKQNSITMVSNVPEPATWAMMLLGFGAVGFQVRRRRSSLAVKYA